MALTEYSLNAKELKYLGIVWDIMEIEGEEINWLNKFTHSEAMFVKLNDDNSPVYKYNISRRRESERLLAEFIKRSENENPKTVLLELYNRKI